VILYVETPTSTEWALPRTGKFGLTMPNQVALKEIMATLTTHCKACLPFDIVVQTGPYRPGSRDQLPDDSGSRNLGLPFV
jgi:hypothetical protein